MHDKRLSTGAYPAAALICDIYGGPNVILEQYTAKCGTWHVRYVVCDTWYAIRGIQYVFFDKSQAATCNAGHASDKYICDRLYGM